MAALKPVLANGPKPGNGWTDLTEKQDLIPRCDFDNGEARFTRDWATWSEDT